MRMMKIGAVTMFTTAQVASAKWHASGRSAKIAVEDRAIGFNRRNEIRSWRTDLTIPGICESEFQTKWTKQNNLFCTFVCCRLFGIGGSW